MTILGRSEELVSRCVECDLAEPESLASLGGSAPGVVDGILSKHINQAYHHFREHVERREILIEATPTKQQIADVLTKPLAEPAFAQHRKAIMGW